MPHKILERKLCPHANIRHVWVEGPYYCVKYEEIRGGKQFDLQNIMTSLMEKGYHVEHTPLEPYGTGYFKIARMAEKEVFEAIKRLQKN